MNFNTLIDTLRDAIHDDSAAQTWCVSNYGRAHKVYSGVDDRNPPGDDGADCPLVVISKVEKDVGYDAEVITHTVEVICEIYDEDGRTVTGKPNAVEYEYVENIESFRKLIETAIAESITSNYPLIHVGRMRVLYEDVEFFPYIDAVMVMELVEDYYQGSEVFG